MRQQYGLRIKSEEFDGMAWDEFADLLSGLNESTPLVKVALVRTESDPQKLKDLTPAQRRMRSEWQAQRAKRKDKREVADAIANLQRAFENMYGESDEQRRQDIG